MQNNRIHNTPEEITMQNNTIAPTQVIDPPPSVNVEPVPVPTRLLRSGMIVAHGIVLRVDRCAPEHGGGVLLTVVPGDMGIPVEPDQEVLVYGAVDDAHLAGLRARYAYHGIDFAAGIR